MPLLARDAARQAIDLVEDKKGAVSRDFEPRNRGDDVRVDVTLIGTESEVCCDILVRPKRRRSCLLKTKWSRLLSVTEPPNMARRVMVWVALYEKSGDEESFAWRRLRSVPGAP